MTSITLKTLPQATAQEVFDQVANHLLNQNKTSLSKYGLCAYRGSEGLKCAAGCLIGDDEYNSDIESKSWKQLVEYQYAPEKHMELIMTLQDLHDHASPNNWPMSLKRVAEEYKLKWT